MLHQSLNTMIRTQQDMLPIIQKAESTIFPCYGTRPTASLSPGLKQRNIGSMNQGNRRRQTCTTGTNHSNFWTLSIHGLNPNSQVFKAIRFLRGEGIAIL